MPRRSLAEYFEIFDGHARETAYVYQRGYRTYRWTYRQIRETAAQFARELEQRGIARGDRVLPVPGSLAQRRRARRSRAALTGRASASSRRRVT